MEIKQIERLLNELKDIHKMWNSFSIDLVAIRKLESSTWLCFGLVFKLSDQIFPYKTEIRFNLNDRLKIVHHCEKFSFDRFATVLREIAKETLTLESLRFKIEKFDPGHFIFERRPGWSREGLRDEEGWPAFIFRSYSTDSELIHSLQEFNELLKIHEEPYDILPELTRKYLHGVEIGGAKRGAIYGVIPRYFKLENLKLDETGTIDVDLVSHMFINPSDLMLSVIIRDESGAVLNSYRVIFDETQYQRSKGNFWRIKKHIEHDLKGVYDARLFLVYKSRSVFEDWIQSKPSRRVIDRTFPIAIADTTALTREGIYFQGETYDAFRLVRKILSDAKENVVIIDGYADEYVLDILTDKKETVEVKILIKPKSVNNIFKIAASRFNEQYKNLSIRSKDHFHDRFVIVDVTDYYHFGASIPHLGQRTFMFSKIEEPLVIRKLFANFNRVWEEAEVVT